MARRSRVTRSSAPSRNPVKRVRRVARSDKETIGQLRQELDESREQQTAAAEVLKIISTSTFDLQTILDTLVETATRLCHAKRGLLFRRDGDLYRGAAYYGFSDEFRAFHETHPISPGRGTTVGRTALEGKTIHIPDLLADPEYTFLEAQKLGQVRANLGVPLLRGGEPIGALSLARSEPMPFTARQIELVETFAAQAVIAIENTRLLNELRESLQQQTATADVLKVISSSPGDLGPVFEAMLGNAVRICEANFGVLFRSQGAEFYPAAWAGVPPEYEEFLRRRGQFRPTDGAPLGRLLKTKQLVFTVDELAERYPGPAAEFGGARSLIAVPMFKDGELVGAIVIYRQEVRPFTERQVALVSNFAAQAVIAIENTRLLNELRQRTDDLSESLQQQTATADVLKVISSSPGQLEPVFNAMLENAVQICGAKFGNLFLCEGDALRAVAFHGTPRAYVEERRRNPVVRPGPTTGLGRVMATKQPVQIPDIQNYEPDSSDSAPGTTGVNLVRLAGARTVLAVPMVKESELVGAIVIYRQEVRSFIEKQIELVQNFASQAAS
jgi:two-component system, NtrC family, sensor kinase